MPRDRRLVWDSDQGRVEPTKQKPKRAESDGIVRIRRETSGRGGKTVTAIWGLPMTPTELSAFAKTLKKACGVGGSAKDGRIEIQGDRRDQCEKLLVEKGYTVKRAGG
ncbi:MAG: stress response translation initiation inhibitor YciH [Planctomycetota bacterium]